MDSMGIRRRLRQCISKAPIIVLDTRFYSRAFIDVSPIPVFVTLRTDCSYCSIGVRR